MYIENVVGFVVVYVVGSCVVVGVIVIFIEEGED